MIRLGSAAGYPFEGPRLLAGWTPPPVPAVYAISYRPDPDQHPDRYAVIYVDHSRDLATEGFPFRHPRAACWLSRADSRWGVHVCWYTIPGGGPGHREQIAQELIAIYRPQCNTRQFAASWDPAWIAGRSASPLSGTHLYREFRRVFAEHRPGMAGATDCGRAPSPRE